MLRAMRAKLLATVILVRWAWVVPVAHTMPIDADGPSGLSDNADFDDLIVSLTSPTAAVTPRVVMVAGGVLCRDRRSRATGGRASKWRHRVFGRKPRAAARLIYHRTHQPTHLRGLHGDG